MHKGGITWTDSDRQAASWIDSNDHLMLKEACAQASKLFNISPARARSAWKAWQHKRF